jgi:hypothetical protein
MRGLQEGEEVDGQIQSRQRVGAGQLNQPNMGAVDDILCNFALLSERRDEE